MEKKSIELAKQLLVEDKIEAATSVLKSLVKSEPTNEKAWIILCGISSRTSNWKLGSESFLRLTELRPKDALASSGLVQCLIELGEIEKAHTEISRFREAADVKASGVEEVLAEFSDLEKKKRSDS